MILLTTKKEAATLVLNLNIMRNEYKKILKKAYKSKKDEYLKSYDYIKAECEQQLTDDLESKELHLNIVDIQVLEAFLVAYTAKLEKVLIEVAKATKEKLEDDKEQIIIMRDIQERCSELLADVS